MAIQAILVQEQEAKTSENIFNPFLTLNTPNLYTITDGIGVAEITNTTDVFLTGSGCMEVRFFVGGGQQISFNAGAYKTDSVVKETGIQRIQYAIKKNNPSASVNFSVQVLLNDTYSSQRDFSQTIYSANGFVDGNWNIYTQTFFANEGDIASLAFTADSDDETAIFWVDNFKLEANNQNSLLPTFYTPPAFLLQKWQKRLDTDNDQVLIEDGENDFGFIGTKITSNTDLTLCTVSGDFVPRTLNAMFTINANFKVKVPSGSNLHIDVYLKGYSSEEDAIVTLIPETKLISKPLDDYQDVNIILMYPVDEDFLQYGGKLILTPRGNNMTISNRSQMAIEQVNSN